MHPWPLGWEFTELIHAHTCICVPQLRRSPIKKVRKSLALDIVDEDMTQNMAALPKTICFKRTQVSVFNTSNLIQGLCDSEFRHGVGAVG